MVWYKSRSSVMYTPTHPSPPHSPSRHLSNLKPKPQHTALVKINRPLAVLHRIRRLGEEHAVVARRLFVLAHAAWLWLVGCLGRWWCLRLRCRGCEGGENVSLVLSGREGRGRDERREAAGEDIFGMCLFVEATAGFAREGRWWCEENESCESSDGVVIVVVAKWRGWW